MSYQVLARKYRPNSFDEVIGQDHVIQVIKNSIEQERVHQAFLFSGTRGIGKTSIARLLAKSLNCMSSDSPTPQPCNKCESSKAIQEGKSIDFLEIDAASRTGVEHMRELLSSVHTSPSISRFKIFLIDEVHMLSKGSFNALLKTLEEPPSHVIFLMATTDPERIPKTVISRCLQLNLKTVSRDELLDHFKQICKKEEIESENIANKADKSLLLNGRNMTNIGLFRWYALAYLQNHPEINPDLTVMVRQLAPTPEGVPLDVYVFVKDKVWVNYERIMSDIFDHLMAAIPFFELECFEYATQPN